MGTHKAPGLLAILAVALLGCHQCGEDGVGNGGGLVGGSCRDHHDCADRCLGGGHFPAGTCSVPCDHDGDCPPDTACVDESGGVCLLLCRGDLDCRPGYECKDRDRRGDPGDIPVCFH